MQLVLFGFEEVEKLADEPVDLVPLRFGQFAERHIEPHLPLRRFLEIHQPRFALRFRPRFHGAPVEREIRVRDDEVHVEVDGVAEPLAPRARPERRIEDFV